MGRKKPRRQAEARPLKAARTRRFPLVRLVVLLILLTGGALAWLCYFAIKPLSVPQSAHEFRVANGASLRAVAKQLSSAGLFPEWISFVALARATGKGNAIKAGLYELPDGITPYGLIGKFSRGEVIMAEITFIEGWTFAQLRDVLNHEPALRHDSATLSDAQLLERLKIPERYAEGLFFPDTYRFAKESSDLVILDRAYKTMQTRLNAAWEHRAAGLPYQRPYEALIMASIVEKETGRPEDRPMIAAVFTNRLKRSMRLQTDPSVIYGLGLGFDGNLRKRDLETDGPYNTYTRDGLPPTPIALPSQAALAATMNPADSGALYFVSRGDGTSQFSDTLDDHNRAVQRFQLHR